MKKSICSAFLLVVFCFLCLGNLQLQAFEGGAAGAAKEQDSPEKFSWWPTDAKPGPVKDEEKGGYWWWPKEPGKIGPLWGNRGYVYVYKIIYDYKADELPEPKPQELRPALVIKKILKNVKIYFDYNKSTIREDAADILKEASKTLKRNPETDILVTGNCDVRGSESYNEKLGRKRAEAVRQFMIGQGLDESRVRIISRGKLDAVAPVTDLLGMQRDRNAQFMIAQVEEVMIPHQSAAGAVEEKIVDESATVKEDQPAEETVEQETIESSLKVETKEYKVKKNDSLWSIAQKELGSGHRWKYLYQINKDRIKNPNKLKIGTIIQIPVE